MFHKWRRARWIQKQMRSSETEDWGVLTIFHGSPKDLFFVKQNVSQSSLPSPTPTVGFYCRTISLYSHLTSSCYLNFSNHLCVYATYLCFHHLRIILQWYKHTFMWDLCFYHVRLWGLDFICYCAQHMADTFFCWIGLNWNSQACPSGYTITASLVPC